MDSPSTNLYTRQSEMPSLTFNLLVTLLIIASIALSAFCLLVIIRRLRNNRRQTGLPVYSEPTACNPAAMAFTGSPHMTQRRSFFGGRGKAADLPTPLVRRDTGPLPEIHIHPAEELDANGKQSSAAVVVVQVGEQSAGQNPDDELPPYEKVGPISARRGAASEDMK